MDRDTAQAIAGIQTTIVGIWFETSSIDPLGSLIGGILILAGTYAVGKVVAASLR